MRAIGILVLFLASCGPSLKRDKLPEILDQLMDDYEAHDESFLTNGQKIMNLNVANHVERHKNRCIGLPSYAPDIATDLTEMRALLDYDGEMASEDIEQVFAYNGLLGSSRMSRREEFITTTLHARDGDPMCAALQTRFAALSERDLPLIKSRIDAVKGEAFSDKQLISIEEREYKTYKRLRASSGINQPRETSEALLDIEVAACVDAALLGEESVAGVSREQVTTMCHAMLSSN